MRPSGRCGGPVRYCGYRPPVLARRAEFRSFAVVALIGSAGAQPSVVEIVARLPADFAAPMIVLLHQAPEFPTLLDAILARKSHLPVSVAESPSTLAPGTVVVVPAGCHMVLAPEYKTRLIPSGAFPPNRPSADLLLSTMGVSLGERAIAVVLSGGGRDGATGATVIHEFGGTVIAADPEETAHPSMPMETIARDEAVDHVLAPQEIADLLIKLTERCTEPNVMKG